MFQKRHGKRSFISRSSKMLATRMKSVSSKNKWQFQTDSYNTFLKYHLILSILKLKRKRRLCLDMRQLRRIRQKTLTFILQRPKSKSDQISSQLYQKQNNDAFLILIESKVKLYRLRNRLHRKKLLKNLGELLNSKKNNLMTQIIIWTPSRR